MDATLRIEVQLDGPDPQVVVEQLQAHATGMEGVSVGGYGWHSDDQPFTVVGVVKGKPDERWSEVVMAQDVAEAETKAKDNAGGSTERTVAATFPGDVVPASDAANE